MDEIIAAMPLVTRFQFMESMQITQRHMWPELCHTTGKEAVDMLYEVRYDPQIRRSRALAISIAMGDSIKCSVIPTVVATMNPSFVAEIAPYLGITKEQFVKGRKLITTLNYVRVTNWISIRDAFGITAEDIMKNLRDVECIRYNHISAMVEIFGFSRKNVVELLNIEMRTLRDFGLEEIRFCMDHFGIGPADVCSRTDEHLLYALRKYTPEKFSYIKDLYGYTAEDVMRVKKSSRQQFSKSTIKCTMNVFGVAL